MSDTYVPLDRLFYALPERVEDGETYDVHSLPLLGERLTWPDLLDRHRIVLLSEAGAGKTAEIRQATRQLRAQQKPAFFIRLEHAALAFEVAFEEGSYPEFQAWLAGSEDGWLLLDSVDEARLRSPQDFDLAIRTIGARLAPAMVRAHIVITSRPYAWRPKTDLQLCERQLPFEVQVEAGAEIPGELSDKPTDRKAAASTRTLGDKRKSPFTILALSDLTRDQVEIFARARGVSDVKAFTDAIERADAWTHTARPQDLEELIGFWTEKSVIGSRLDLMRASMRRRMQELDPNRAEARPLPPAKAEDGARLAAAACTLVRTPTIQAPGAEAPGAVKLSELLPNWTEKEHGSLLSRPVFDEAIYGGVRFYHRSAREFLAAEWLAELLRRGASRRRAEQVLFRVQYGLEVIVPETRPLLPWLAIADDRICARIQRLAPEVFFEGGDPSALPLAVRQRILADTVEAIVSRTTPRSLIDSSGIERFVGRDLTAEVKALLTAHAGNSEVEWFLLRVAWQGRLSDALPEARRVALDPGAELYARIAAFRAVEAIGSPQDMAEVRAFFAVEADQLNRGWIAELISLLPDSEEDLDWLFAVIVKSQPCDPHGADNLSYALNGLVERLVVGRLASFVARAASLLDQPPYIEHRRCEVSQRYAWLLRSAGAAVLRMGQARSDSALSDAALGVLERIPSANDYDRGDVSELKPGLASLVGEWRDLNWALFWRVVARERARLAESGKALHDYRTVPLWATFVTFGPKDFEAALQAVADRERLDDRLIVLTLAFCLYVEAGRLAEARARLKALAAVAPELDARLKYLLKPPAISPEVRRIRKMEAGWRRRSKAREEQQAVELSKAKTYLEENLDTAVRAPILETPDGITQAQLYLLQRATDRENAISKYSCNTWRTLIPQYGERVAAAFREAAVAYWRKGRPKLVSEGAPENSVLFTTVFGLVGLAIEADETPGWPEALSPEDAERAFRYAMHELNGFPTWFPRLAERFPDLMRDLAMTELRFELASDSAEHDRHYLLSDLSWSGKWLWDGVASALREVLSKAEPNNLNGLRQVLAILQGSFLADSELAALAKPKAQALVDDDHAAIWFAVWTGVDPQAATAALRQKLVSIGDKAAATHFAMVFVTQLVGSRFSRSAARGAYRSAQLLKELYLLVSAYVTQADDIERSGKGSYSPGLRDEAQDARNTLFSLLRELPGKDAYVAMVEISREHSDPEFRNWALWHAKAKATQDANGDAWTVNQVREFADDLERTPETHRELFDLAVMRFEDLKADLEEGDASDAAVLSRVNDETELRNYLGGRLRLSAQGRYSIPQEEELADARRPDLRFHHAPVDAPVPAELKLSHRWTLKELFERLETQVCGGYLRDMRSTRGLLVVVHQGKKHKWDLPDGAGRVDFAGVVVALEQHWAAIADRFPDVQELKVVGIDLTKRVGRNLKGEEMKGQEV